MLQRMLVTHLGVRLPYVVSAGIVLLFWVPLLWKGRWPIVSETANSTWRLQVSPKGLAACANVSVASWREWSQTLVVSVRRVRPDLCRVRIRHKDRPAESEIVDVDMVVSCDEEKIEEVAKYIEACREGRVAEVPVLASEPLAAREMATRGESTGSGKQDDLWRIEYCPECGYDLAGLPSKGQCPECGFEYDGEALIVLYGRDAIAPGYWPASRTGRIVIFAMVMGIGNALAAFLAMSFGLTGAIQGILGGLIIGGFTAVLGYISRTSRRSGRVPFGLNTQQIAGQVRLSPAGFGVRTGHGRCPPQPWSSRKRLRVDHLKGSTYRLQIASFRRFPRFVWARLDFEADDQMVARIVERVALWRGVQTATPAEAGAA
jgi:hypothetical protein